MRRVVLYASPVSVFVFALVLTFVYRSIYVSDTSKLGQGAASNGVTAAPRLSPREMDVFVYIVEDVCSATGAATGDPVLRKTYFANLASWTKCVNESCHTKRSPTMVVLSHFADTDHGESHSCMKIQVDGFLPLEVSRSAMSMRSFCKSCHGDSAALHIVISSDSVIESRDENTDSAGGTPLPFMLLDLISQDWESNAHQLSLPWFYSVSHKASSSKVVAFVLVSASADHQTWLDFESFLLRHRTEWFIWPDAAHTATARDDKVWKQFEAASCEGTVARWWSRFCSHSERAAIGTRRHIYLGTHGHAYFADT
ncbi:hypothetical protein FVE85_7295 [Porphyridium purpureum]|uniref:Uncharacterized protein n=1 Tax=Porphyridium purpureum TaxID=35688 RepID=A0A5J4Z9B0_PORPP|nr:hypothetical protein FVE85_7295 [Porphyridium purpureum]|eukprot:POR7984..scf295_1